MTKDRIDKELIKEVVREAIFEVDREKAKVSYIESLCGRISFITLELERLEASILRDTPNEDKIYILEQINILNEYLKRLKNRYEEETND